MPQSDAPKESVPSVGASSISRADDGMILTEQERHRIRLEEIFRSEVKEQIEKAKGRPSRRARFLAFFNTGLGLWLLSSIAVGTISWSYSEWSRYQQSKETKQELIRKLDLEIAVRLRYFNSLVSEANNLRTFYEALRGLEQPSWLVRGLPNTVFPQFSERSFRSLLWELYTIVPSAEKQPILGALRQAQELAERITPSDAKRSQNPFALEKAPVPQEALNLVKTAIGKEFNLNRWALP